MVFFRRRGTDKIIYNNKINTLREPVLVDPVFYPMRELLLAFKERVQVAGVDRLATAL